MKRFLLSVFLLIVYLYSFSATKTWIGSSGNWSGINNWMPSGIPVAGDDIIINNSVTIVVDVASPIALNSITVTNNSNVTFGCPATKNFILSSISSVNPALLINTSSTLTLNGTNAGSNNSSLDLTYGTGVIGSIYGTLIISKTGGAPSNPGVQLITDNNNTNYGIVTVYPGGAIKIYPNAGNTSSSLSPTPTIIMKNGSVYENLKDGGSFPVGTWESNSLAKASSPGSNCPVFLGSSYGNLEWNCPNQTSTLSNYFNQDISFTNVSIVSTNSGDPNGEIKIAAGNSAAAPTMAINGNLLQMGANARLVITSGSVTAGNGGKLHLKGNLNNQGTITSEGITGTINDFELNGTSNQNIINGGTLSGSELVFTMNNPAGATLLTPLTLPGNGYLLQGKIKTTSTNILTMVENGSFGFTINPSATSFIDGPMRKVGADPYFTFPIGKGSIFAKIGYSCASSYTATDTFTAEYFRVNPQSTYGTSYEILPPPDNIDHISYVEYWRLEKNAGSIPPTMVDIRVSEYSFCRILSTTFIARYDPNNNKWKNIGTSDRIPFIMPPPYYMADINGNTDLTELGIFTLATSDPFADNPLPINLISFDAIKINSQKSSLSWELAAFCSAAAKFEIQRAGDDRRFNTIAAVNGNETNRFYSLADNNLKNGVNYYRLKMTDANGSITYSRIATVLNGIRGLFITMSPTIVATGATLTFASSEEQQLDLFIVDVQGRTVRRLHQHVAGGNTNIVLSLNDLHSGVYQLVGITANGQKNVIRFIKQ